MRLPLRFTRRGRAQLRAKRILRRILVDLKERHTRAEVDRQIAELYRLDREALGARFEAWDRAEDDRIFAQLLDDYQILYPGVPRGEILQVVDDRVFHTLAADLPAKEEPA